MHVIIPMSGVGKRFLDAGYKVHKALIDIDGKPVIQHVCDLFPGENKITFVCQDEHLQTTPMREILTAIRPEANIIAIKPHKLGPVFAVSQVFELIDDEEEIIVNYCDFSTYWNYKDFLQHTRNRNADGAIVAYRDFHPHMLGSTNYAFMQEQNNWLLKIQEKKPFTDNRMQEYASNGTYYFKRGMYVKKYFQKLMDLDLSLNGEYYVSMVYNLLCQDQLKISIYEIQHMLQWGTPEDVAVYLKWSQYFKALVERPFLPFNLPSPHINLMALAGRGSRFQKEGYELPKPLIPVSGKSMVEQALFDLPEADEQRFVCLQEHLTEYPLLQQTLRSCHPKTHITALPKVTEGQAISVAAGLNNLDEGTSVLITACDSNMLFDKQQFMALAESPAVDGIIFTFKNHPSVKNNPEMYGYVKTDEQNNVTGVSVKVPISSTPVNDHAIVGNFFVKRVETFRKGLEALLAKNVRVNNEFYVDSLMGELVALGFRLKVLEVEYYICWGTPDDLRTFQYWQSFFHKASFHPYRLEKDPMMKVSALVALEKSYTDFSQRNPEESLP